jgi:hypothetical protein
MKVATSPTGKADRDEPKEVLLHADALVLSPMMMPGLSNI